MGVICPAATAGHMSYGHMSYGHMQWQVVVVVGAIMKGHRVGRIRISD